MNTDKVKAKIIDLVPDSMDFLDHCPNPDCGAGIPAPITLAVVLRAIHKAKENGKYEGIRADGNFTTDFGERAAFTADGQTPIKWNLEHDNYNQQSEECKQFIGSLLGV